MPVSERQLAAFADTHAWRIPFDTSPRHLAGPGDGRHVTHGLAAAGWKRTSEPLSPEIVLTSPDHRHSLQFDPQSATAARWRLRADPTDTEPGWYAEFGELVPAEVLGAVTDALVTPSTAEPRTLLDAAAAAGWLIGARGAASSPDAACRVERRPERNAAVSWHVEAHEPEHSPRGPRLWHAWFDARTPTRLVDAFVTALADPAPLQRGMFDRTAHGAVQEPSPLSPQHVVDAHTERLRALRARTRAARRRPQPETAKAPALPPSPPASLRR
ncbi:DUF317 domain-containing protein [Streptomyces sp. NBC_01635]|uniref:DUF317 domain-containing protein n=1 Tax=Streptomyces sp. NBC_01635 TaxID=2975904 RepID=UPI003863699E|nr:DUF317 domain-containing protein [Streptomyces sp. NBC_01635]